VIGAPGSLVGMEIGPMPSRSQGPPVTRPATARDLAVAEPLLGATHPLVGLLRRSQIAVEQALLIAAVDLVAGVLVYRGAAIGAPLAIAATVALAAACMRVAVLQQSRRDLCVDLIVGGAGRLPLAAVEREWRRLEDPRHRTSLACSLEETVKVAGRPLPGLPSSRPLFTTRVIRPLAAQLSEIAGLLRDGSPEVRGVALVERLLTSGGSPLYGTNIDLLREELLRARYLLTPAFPAQRGERSASRWP
jgi:hypothetical protein